MTKTNYTIIIPVITTILALISLSGIIGNGIILGTTSNNNFVYNMNNLDPGKLDSRTLYIDSSFSASPKIEIRIAYTNPLTNQNSHYVDLYLMNDRLPTSITNSSGFTDSSYYKDQYLESANNVNTETTFYLQNTDSIIYLVASNPTSQTISFTITISVSAIGAASTPDVARILGVVFSSIFTAAFIVISVYLWSEYFEKTPKRILTKNIEERIDNIRENTLTWEQVLIGLGIALILVGYGNLLIGGDPIGFGYAAVCFGIAYYSYNKRQRIAKKIHEILLTNQEIRLKELSKLIVESESDTKKALLDAIMYNNLPATFDFKTEVVKYNPEKKNKSYPEEIVAPTMEEASFQIASTEVVSRQIPKDEEVPTRALPKCAYCGIEAISANALFCHSCGASMSSAK